MRLFRGDRFRFEFGMRPAEANWFRLASPELPQLEERRELIRRQPHDYAPWLAEADPVLDELLALFVEPGARALIGGGAAAGRELAGLWEPDFVLLRRDSAGAFRMVGGCVCDPSWWNPAEKLGLPIEAIHAPVPTLNAELGSRIRKFLERLPSETTFTRENWGLAAVPDRNLHPHLKRQRLDAQASLGRTWLRIEHQAFRSLPQSEGLAFVIWLTVHPLSEVTRNPEVASAFHRQLTTMPEEIARYKGLAEARESLLAQISATGLAA
ncbi:MAG TPA: DUF3445 domain-containing protein [Verrucomicrobiota bacterium]|nr:DUF3445 domain-containing protein [Verrucomicrobiota bacterium]